MIVEKLFNLIFSIYKRYRRPVKRWFKKTPKTLLLGVGLILTGLTIAGVSLLSVWLAQRSSADVARTNHALVSNAVKADVNPLVMGQPVHISIPSVGIDLNVIPGYYNASDQSWTLTTDNAQYAAITAQPNNKQGDTFIYAHARVGLFATLPQVQPGDQVIITTSNHHTFSYTFDHSVITTPSDTSLFSYTGKPILVLQTCTGLWWQDRQLFTFNFTSNT